RIAALAGATADKRVDPVQAVQDLRRRYDDVVLLLECMGADSPDAQVAKHTLHHLRDHLDAPRPWRVQRDWTWEVVAADGTLVDKCDDEPTALRVCAKANRAGGPPPGIVEPSAASKLAASRARWISSAYALEKRVGDSFFAAFGVCASQCHAHQTDGCGPVQIEVLLTFQPAQAHFDWASDVRELLRRDGVPV